MFAMRAGHQLKVEKTFFLCLFDFNGLKAFFEHYPYCSVALHVFLNRSLIVFYW